MIILGVLLSVFGLGVFCWALFSLAVFALPFFAALSVGFAALHTGANPIGAIGVGFMAGVLTLVAGQSVFTLVQSAVMRGAVALLFAAPAAVAGYYLSLHLSGLAASSAAWQQAFAVVGAAVAGITSVARLMLPLPPAPRPSAMPAAAE